MKKLAVLLTILCLSGCALVAPDTNAYLKLNQSQEVYRKCLTDNSTNTSACAGARQIYEMDLAAYRATSAAQPIEVRQAPY